MIKRQIIHFFVLIISFIFFNTETMSLLDDENSDDSDKYEQAITICRNTPSLSSDERSRDYEDAMRICGAASHRLPFYSVWGLNTYNSIGGDDYKSLIAVELHHVAGDMMHIVKLRNDSDYREKVETAIERYLKEKWLKKNKDAVLRGKLSTSKIRVPEISYNNDNDMCKDFIVMIGFFKRWDELQKSGTEDNFRYFLSNIKRQYSINIYTLKYKYEYTDFGDCIDDGERLLLLKYRKQRKLNLTGESFDTIQRRERLKKEEKARKSEEEAKRRAWRREHERMSWSPAAEPYRQNNHMTPMQIAAIEAEQQKGLAEERQRQQQQQQEKQFRDNMNREAQRWGEYRRNGTWS